MPSGQTTEIASLVEARIKTLGITKSELAARCGFRNVSKGLRRLDQLCVGDFSSAQFLLNNLADALSVDVSKVESAVQATMRAKLLKAEQTYRDTFIPHGIILTERSRPEPMFVAWIIGIANILRIDFAEGSTPISFAGQALNGIVQRMASYPNLPAFGKPTGFVVNYNPDKAVEFSLDGKPLFIHYRAVRVGEAMFPRWERTLAFLRDGQ